tara:strand:- start:14199 stop:14942 length:744 start_codon:yes stop_codon:yes gene_type:complete
MNAQNVLQNCTVNGNIVSLPTGKLDRKIYMEVAKSLNLIGGKWKGHKVQGFVFESNPTELLKSIATGDKRNLKKEFQFFETPKELARHLVGLAQIEPQHTVLEPSAGQGSIVRAINDLSGVTPAIYELMPTNRIVLENRKYQDGMEYELLGNDFLENTKKFHRIIANPPFNKNQDVTHIMKMYNSLEKGGRLVSVASPHWTFGTEKVCEEFRKFLHFANSIVEDIPAGVFKASGTMIGAKIIIIDRD